MVIIKFHTKNQPFRLLNSGDGYEEDLKIRIWKMTSTTFPIFHNISFSLVKIKLLTNNQIPSLLNSGDVYEEDLKIWIWKMTSL